MVLNCVWEHNGDDTILYAVDLPGAYTRGENLHEALLKMPREAVSYLSWLGREAGAIEAVVTEEKASDLNIRDADSDVIFSAERKILTLAEYRELKAIALKSAADFQRLYDSVPEKNRSTAPARKTFYGDVPRTAEEMYRHTKSVNEYYFAEIDVPADNEGTVYDCRARGFEALERQADFLTRGAVEGSYGEEWSLRKVLRRFIWHDRIHAKAMYRMAVREFNSVPNVFYFDI